MAEGWKHGFFTRFECPLCGSARYREARVPKVSGKGLYVTPFLECLGCSLMFRDPVLLTRCEVDTRNDGRTPGGAHLMSRATEMPAASSSEPGGETPSPESSS